MSYDPNCNNCLHDGECDALHHCGGRAYSPRVVQCRDCGCDIDRAQDDYEHPAPDKYLCEACANSADS